MRACTFFGHRDCPETMRQKLSDVVERLIIEERVSVFYIGTHGNFDKMAYSVLSQLAQRYIIDVYVVLAHLRRATGSRVFDMRKTVYPEGLETVPRRFAIVKRNQYMIEKSDFVICYVNDNVTNAFKFVSRAKRKGLRIFNIGNYIFDE